MKHVAWFAFFHPTVQFVLSRRTAGRDATEKPDDEVQKSGTVFGIDVYVGQCPYKSSLPSFLPLLVVMHMLANVLYETFLH